VEKKIKFIIIGLIGLLVISLVINFQTNVSKESVVRERNELKKEALSLSEEIERSRQEKRSLEQQLNSLKADLDRAIQAKGELEKKFDLVSRERLELIEKMKSQKKAAEAREEQRAPASAVAAPPAAEDSYWAGILKAKTDLEFQLESLRNDLKSVQINNEQLTREKSALELEVSGLQRQEQDLKRQVEYNQKLMDSLAQELVREKNDKYQINDILQAIKGEDEILRRQFKSLNDRKIDLERKFAELQRENTKLNSRLTEMGTLLEEKTLQIDNLKKQLDAVQEGRVAVAGQKDTVELPTIVVRPQGETSSRSETRESNVLVSGKVLAVNRENNFAIIDLGEEAGVKVGDTFQVYRNNEPIASIEAIQTRRAITACDIKRETTPIKVGDAVR
jgi:predicted nuclease with TOPRIM domain